MKTNVKIQLKKTAGSALFLALAMVLPLLTGQLQAVGNALCPMHIPVLLCGMIYGPFWGGLIGFIAPLLRFAIFSMPPLFPVGLPMAFELMGYGIISGLMLKILPDCFGRTYIALACAVVGGRLVWALAKTVLFLFGWPKFTFMIFLTEGFVNAIIGIIVQFLIIPPIVMAFKKARLMLN